MESDVGLSSRERREELDVYDRSARRCTYHKSIDFDLRRARRFVGLRAEGLEASSQAARGFYARLLARALGHLYLSDMMIADFAVSLLPMLEFGTQGLGARRVLRLFQELILHLQRGEKVP